MGTAATLTETREAQRFLRLLGISNTNVYVLASIVAWIRVSGKLWDAAAFAKRLLQGSIYTNPTSIPLWGKENPTEWTDYLRGLQAQAQLFQSMLQALRRKDSGGGVDFLYGLALSDWDAQHYGGTDDWTHNRLALALAKITGLTLPPPVQPKAKAAPRGPQPLTPQLEHRPSQMNYLQPYAARSFYRERHPTLPPLAGGLYDPSV